MLFTSYQFLFLFLPLAVVAYFVACRISHSFAIGVLIAASFLFYASFDARYTLLLAGSILVNYSISHAITGCRPASRQRAAWAVLGVGVNLALLGYFKYTDFCIATINSAAGASFPLLHVFLPLGISFFTFQQIGYVVDTYRGDTLLPRLHEYAIYVCFFPHLIAGPIVHNKEIIAQFQDTRLKTVNWDNIYAGLTLFITGLLKKVVIADTLSPIAAVGFDKEAVPHLLLSWVSTLAYTLQLYFDFSGYSDMAIGLACMINIKFPQNFNLPYAALDIQDFWRRWHITLSRFFRQYLYIPLGGNRKGEARTLANMFAVFFLGGLWHGAGWTFIAWGTLHGLAIVAHRIWRNLNFALPKVLAWSATFLFVNAAWVFFRAKSLGSALGILQGMAGLNGIDMAHDYGELRDKLPWKELLTPFSYIADGLLLVFVVLVIVEMFYCSLPKLLERVVPDKPKPLVYATLFLAAIVMNSRFSEFIYFQF